jgi:2-dehydro-3-deoxy-D-arabinonate dehydratase
MQNPDKGGEKWDLGIRDLKIFRVISRGIKHVYLKEGEKVFETSMDPVEVLGLYAHKGEIMRRETRIDFENLLIKDFSHAEDRVTLPFDPPEVWGSGITYEMSRRRYSEEKVPKIMDKTIYEAVYEAQRPEVFFKATAPRCVGHGEPIRIRRDSVWTLPEAELAVVIDENGSIMGFSAADDVSARDIESENPLYLPQSKIFSGCFAMGPCIVTPDEIGDPYSLKVELKIKRGGQTVYQNSTSTSKMKRRLNEQIEYLLRDNPVPRGTVLSTGTGIVPGRDVSLQEHDIVEIQIEKIGVLVTPVIKSDVQYK